MSVEFRRAATFLNLSPLPVLYQIRHAGASNDFSGGLRSLSEIKRRGRWKTDASVRRYEKGGRVTEQLLALRPGVQRHAIACLVQIPDVLSGRRPPLPSPHS